MPPLHAFNRNTEALAEASNGVYRTVLTYGRVNPTTGEIETGTIDASAVASLTLTLTDDSGAIVNGRSAQDVKNANDGTLLTNGVFFFELQPLDTAIGASVTADWVVLHATFKIVFSGGTQYQQEDFYVRNLAGVP